MSHWGRKLAEPTRLRGGRSIETLSQARHLILSLTDVRPFWVCAGELLLAAAQSGEAGDIHRTFRCRQRLPWKTRTLQFGGVSKALKSRSMLASRFANLATSSLRLTIGGAQRAAEHGHCSAA
jgi:hypothetical protein